MPNITEGQKVFVLWNATEVRIATVVGITPKKSYRIVLTDGSKATVGRNNLRTIAEEIDHRNSFVVGQVNAEITAALQAVEKMGNRKQRTVKIFPYEWEYPAWKCAHTVETTVHKKGEIKLCLACVALLDDGAKYEKMEMEKAAK